MLTKLKFASLSRDKLINIYCAVVWHENFTKAQSKAIERLQIVGLKIILGNDCPKKEDGHVDYVAALMICKC